MTKVIIVNDTRNVSLVPRLQEYTAAAGPTADFTAVPSGLSVDFINTSTPGDNPITSHLWDFGDGDSSSKSDPTHLYESDGDYTVTLLETDSAGRTSMAQQEVSVAAAGGARGTITMTKLDSGRTPDNLTVYSSGSYVPTAGRLLVAMSEVTDTGATPRVIDVQGNGLTWYQVVFPNNYQNRRANIWVAYTGDSPTAGALTWTLSEEAGDLSWGIIEIDGADVSGHPTQAVLQVSWLISESVSSIPADLLSPLEDAANAMLVMLWGITNESITPDPSFTELFDEQGNFSQFQAQWAVGEAACISSVTTPDDFVTIALEIKSSE